MTSRVWHDKDADDGKFAWVLEVLGVPSECTEVRWEQFVSGGFTIEFTDGTSKFYSAPAYMQRIDPRTRQFGPWSDDLLREMVPGPRPVGAYFAAGCSRGILRAPLKMLRGVAGAARYRFGDAPGFPISFGDTFEGKTFH